VEPPGPEQARASLRQCVKESRALPTTAPAVHATREPLMLDRDAVEVDLHEISRAASQRDLTARADRLGRIGGDLLEDFMDLSPASAPSACVTSAATRLPSG